ncbi:MAG: ribose 5-phosphate isomerase B [Candidatus Aminicenantes bacterium]|nr:ribose 5-phosphate isomerase B [Candidatus Aminicenantes bacterium]
MRIILASDHAGYGLKTEIASFLSGRGFDVVDAGCGPGESVDYVDYAAKAAAALVRGDRDRDRAILFCGTGMGMALAANKFKGVRATPCWTVFTAEMSRKHNDANCLTLGGRVLTPAEAEAIVAVWLETSFEGGRHLRRVDKIRRLEDEHFK